MAAPALALVGADRAAELTAASHRWPSLVLAPDQLADLELLLLGAFGPVPGYPEDTLRDGLRVPGLVVPARAAAGLGRGDPVALRDPDGVLLAALSLRAVLPQERAAARRAGEPVVRLAGTLAGLRLPDHPDHRELRLRPDQLRAELRRRGWHTPPLPWAVWADGLLHTADVARIRALSRQGRRCVVLAPVGGADPTDPRHHLRVRALRAALDALREPLRPAEATLAHPAIAAEATRPAHPPGLAEPGGQPPAGEPGPLLVLVPVVPSPELAAPREPGFTATPLRGGLAAGQAEEPGSADRLAELISLRAHLAEFYGLGGSLTGPALGTPGRAELAAFLAAGRSVPAELTPPPVAAELASAYPPRVARGFTVLFSGPPDAGTSRLARLLTCRLLERGRRHVTLLDRGAAWAYLGGEPDPARADQALATRVGFVAAEVSAAGGIAVCAPDVTQTAAARARALVERTGAGFVHVRVTTAPAGQGQAGAQQRPGAPAGPAGGAEPAAGPGGAELTVDITALCADEAVAAVLAHLRCAGWLAH